MLEPALRRLNSCRFETDDDLGYVLELLRRHPEYHELKRMGLRRALDVGATAAARTILESLAAPWPELPRDYRIDLLALGVKGLGESPLLAVLRVEPDEMVIIRAAAMIQARRREHELRRVLEFIAEHVADPGGREFVQSLLDAGRRR